MKPVIALGSLICGIAALVAAVGLHAPTSFAPPLPDIEPAPEVKVEVLPEIGPVEAPKRTAPVVAKRPVAKKSRRCAESSRRCYEQKLEQGGRPGANYVWVCD